jgi:two-component system KDP operon response regulator KdpE
VDDDPAILRVVGKALEASGFDVRSLSMGAEVLREVSSFRPDVVLLDLVLPDADGVDVCRAIRETSSVPVIVLSAVGAEAQKVRALDDGADDYVTKPFGMDELHARIRVALRRNAGLARETGLAAGTLRLDLETREVTVDGRWVHLTPTEFELCRLLLQHAGRILTQRQILNAVWGAEYLDDSHVLRTFVHQLRQKLDQQSPEAGRMIVTEPGVGYRLVAPST